MNINWNFISELEGKGVKKAYVPSDNSGVTVATGFDLKEKDVNLMNEMGISEETTNFCHLSSVLSSSRKIL